ncbi:MAG: hypothetical protein JWO38_3490 [Gemmataceae bacterium]|nr:hypothetical protein [Gemmataceae bacterium]
MRSLRSIGAALLMILGSLGLVAGTPDRAAAQHYHWHGGYNHPYYWHHGYYNPYYAYSPYYNWNGAYGGYYGTYPYYSWYQTYPWGWYW